MAVPKKKSSLSRRGMRRAGQTHKLYAKTTGKCPNCNARVLAHHVCPSCGHYKGKEVIVIASPEEATEDHE